MHNKSVYHIWYSERGFLFSNINELKQFYIFIFSCYIFKVLKNNTKYAFGKEWILLVWLKNILIEKAYFKKNVAMLLTSQVMSLMLSHIKNAY